VRRAAPAVAVVLLIAIGAIEASVSAQQLAEAIGRPRLEGAGVTLTAAGLLASALIYLVLGHIALDDRAALHAGALTGAFAGCALLRRARSAHAKQMSAASPREYAAVPDWFVTLALCVFVALSCAVSTLGGGAIAWTGRRLSRAARSRPPA